MPYTKRDTIRNPAFTLNLTSSTGGRLRYLGARHSNDPSDPEFADIITAWNEFKPTIAFYEGSVARLRATSEESIRNAGEPGLVQFLAARDSIPAISLEPSRQDEAKHLLATFSAEQVKLFYALRPVAELRERQKLSQSELREAAVGILDRLSGLNGLEGVVRNLDELEAAYGRYWKTPQHWWDAPSDWFNPLKSSSETGGIFLNEVNQESSTFRDLNMFTVLANACSEGKRVFAVVGRDHVPMQAPALRCAIK